METLGERLRRLRELRGMTQGELAIAAGLATSTISGIERETQKSSSSLDRIAKALGCTPDFLRDGKDAAEMPVFNAELLSAREAALIVKFRNISARDRDRVEAFLTAMPEKRSGKNPGHRQQPDDHQTMARYRRSG